MGVNWEFFFTDAIPFLIEAVEEYCAIRTLDVDLAQGRHIADTHARAYGLYFARDDLEPIGLPGCGEPLRAQPIAGLDEPGATLDGPGVSDGEARGLKVLAAMNPGEGSKRYRRVRRPRGSCSYLWDRTLSERSHDRVSVNVRGFPLVARHAERGVALQQLDRAKTFARSERHVITSHVVLEIDEGL